MIVQPRVCPALIVPAAEFDPGATWWQSIVKRGAKNPATGVSVTVKVPRPNETDRVSLFSRVNEDG
jgi:hypothetical protein